MTIDCFHGWDGVSNPMEPGNDLVKSRDNVSGNDRVDGGFGTERCVIDAGDFSANCEL